MDREQPLVPLIIFPEKVNLGLVRIPDSNGYKGERDIEIPLNVWCDNENKPRVSALVILPPSHVGDKLRMKIFK